MLKFDSCSSCASITGSLFSIKADDLSLPRYWLNCVSKIGLSNIQHQYISTVWWKKTGRRVLNWTTIRLPLTQSSCLTNLCVSTREQPSLESSIYWVQRRGYFCCPRSEWEPQGFRLHESNFLMSLWEKCSSKHSTALLLFLLCVSFFLSPLSIWMFCVANMSYSHMLTHSCFFHYSNILSSLLSQTNWSSNPVSSQ